jgi:hypothetical protein
MSDHRSTETRFPEWAIIPLTILYLCVLAALVAALCAFASYYAGTC